MGKIKFLISAPFLVDFFQAMSQEFMTHTVLNIIWHYYNIKICIIALLSRSFEKNSKNGPVVKNDQSPFLSSSANTKHLLIMKTSVYDRTHHVLLETHTNKNVTPHVAAPESKNGENHEMVKYIKFGRSAATWWVKFLFVCVSSRTWCVLSCTEVFIIVRC